MKIRFLGHAAFELTLGNGKKIIFDPYESGAFNGAVKYSPIEGEYDVALVSHDHADHVCDEVITRCGKVHDTAGEFEDEDVRGTMIATYHDESEGSERGSNLVSIMEVDGMKLAHMGDLGHQPSEELYELLDGVDIMLIPVGGHFTIDDAAAEEIAGRVKPRILIPMHFKTDKVDFPLKTVDDFIDRMDNVERTGGSEITVTSDSLPGEMKVIVLEPAL